MTKIKIGFLGLGVVGAELVNIVQQAHDRILEKYEIDLVIGEVFVRDLNKKRGTNVDLLKLTTNPDDIIFDKDTDIVCECIGGAGSELTYNYVTAAIKQGKSIVMSSKKALALYAKEILNNIQSSTALLRYDATVGGGIPIEKIFANSFFGEKITKITAIVNATSNYIYTKMSTEKAIFEEALKNAQICGYAENDPSDDILSYDALYKTVILSTFGMDKYFSPIDLEIVPFSNVTVEDINFSSKLGYSIKPIIHIEDVDDILLYLIGPCLINKRDIIANTFENNNIIKVKGDLSGSLAFYGQGAGNKPTASAMFDDIMSIIKCEKNMFEYDRTNNKLCDSLVKKRKQCSI